MRTILFGSTTTTAATALLLGFLLSFWIASVEGSQQPQPLIPPLSPVRNVTGSLNTFLEQVQEMNNADAPPPVVIMGNGNPSRASQVIQPVAVPVVVPAVPTAPPASHALPGGQPQPVIDPALQRLLNSFNTVPPVDYAHPQQVAYSVAPMVPGQPTVISYVTCYVGCSHVTNVVSAAEYLTPHLGLLIGSVFLSLMLI